MILHNRWRNCYGCSTVCYTLLQMIPHHIISKECSSFGSHHLFLPPSCEKVNALKSTVLSEVRTCLTSIAFSCITTSNKARRCVAQPVPSTHAHLTTTIPLNWHQSMDKKALLINFRSVSYH